MLPTWARRHVRRWTTAYSVRSRQRKAELIEEFITRTGARSMVMCGALGSQTLANESVIERRIAKKVASVTAFDVVDRGPQPWPFVIADARAMPFGDQEYDLAVSNAVIEHVGDDGDQQRMVAEHVRVARDWVITTPNRWFPIEAHTVRVLMHWSPRWRASRDEFTRLLSMREFKALLPAEARVIGRPWSPTFTALSR